MTNTTNIQIPCVGPDGPAWISLAEFIDLVNASNVITVDEPIKIKTYPPVVIDLGSDLIGELVGSHDGNPVYKAITGNHYYERAGVYLLPRGTNLPFDALSGVVKLTGNDCPTGAVGVPKNYVLPAGCGWGKFDDGAFYLVFHPTTEPGPDWLLPKAEPAPTTSATSTHKTTPWGPDKPKES